MGIEEMNGYFNNKGRKGFLQASYCAEKDLESRHWTPKTCFGAEKCTVFRNFSFLGGTEYLFPHEPKATAIVRRCQSFQS